MRIVEVMAQVKTNIPKSEQHSSSIQRYALYTLLHKLRMHKLVCGVVCALVVIIDTFMGVGVLKEEYGFFCSFSDTLCFANTACAGR